MTAAGAVARGTVPLYFALAVPGVLLGGGAADSGADPASAAVGLAFAAVGALLVARVPRHPIGWLFVAMALWGAVAELASGWAHRGLVADPGSLPGAEAAAWVSGWGVSVYLGIFALLLFPTGRPPSPAWRPVIAAAAAWLALLAVTYAFAPGPLWTLPQVDNPLGIEALAGVLDHAQALETAGGTLTMLATVAALAVRFRASRGVERLQLKWLTLVVCLMGALVVAAGVLQAAGVDESPVSEAAATAVYLVVLAGVPVAIGIAILRHRLYDIDLVIRRTLVYGALTATLGATYLGLVLLAGLAVGDSGLAVAASTLAVAALARPALARIQAGVDRRFYRRRYDAALTLEAFGARLRDELDLDEIAADLSSVARGTVQPAHVSLWLRAPR